MGENYLKETITGKMFRRLIYLKNSTFLNLKLLVCTHCRERNIANTLLKVNTYKPSFPTRIFQFVSGHVSG